MKAVYSHGVEHTVYDAERRIDWLIPANGYRDLPDDVADDCLVAHRNKLCNVSGEADPRQHRCILTTRQEKAAALFRATVMKHPEMTTVAEPAGFLTQRQKLMRRGVARYNRLARA